MSLDICKHPWHHHHNQDNSYIQHLPGVPVSLLLLVWFFVVRTLNMSYSLLKYLEVYNTVLLTIDMRYYLRWLLLKIQQMLARMWRNWNAHTSWECRMVQPLWKTVRRVLKKLKIELPYDPAIPLLVIYLKNWNQDLKKISSPPCSFQHYSQ